MFDEECFPGNEECAIPFELKMRNDKNKAESRNRKEMNSTNAVRAARQTRTRALIVPREHGAWGLLLVPLFTGVVAGFASEHRIWPLLMFTVAALSLFWLRTPVESLIGTSSLTANTERERRTVLIASILLAALASACLTELMWKGQNLQLLLLGAATVFALGSKRCSDDWAGEREWRLSWSAQLASPALLRLLTTSAPGGSASAPSSCGRPTGSS